MVEVRDEARVIVVQVGARTVEFREEARGDVAHSGVCIVEHGFQVDGTPGEARNAHNPCFLLCSDLVIVMASDACGPQVINANVFELC
jgi:hypothetical protein